ncbi:MAG: SDR family NAD(P)-dependent oxidoreductase, partial [Bdellovibrionales bacterium]|nr:SDR family NAD(P)-dependent oxidoreductase [Bdellovibrionales bacterium]
MSESRKKVAVVTGANQGLGFETARQLARKGYQVVLTARNIQKGKDAAKKLADEGLDVDFHPLDVTRTEDVQALRSYISSQYKKLDALVNNAGVFLESGPDFDGDKASALSVP